MSIKTQHTGEPNNFGKPVPGEDCAVAHLGDPEHGFEWYDVPCNIQGFYVSEEHSFSFNPLCEHERFQEEPFQYKVEGVEQVRSPRFFCNVLDILYLLRTGSLLVMISTSSSKHRTG